MNFALTSTPELNTTPAYTNPILAGFYPDPSICRKDDEYFLVCSTFAYFPAIPVFHSYDLVNWKLAGHVLDRTTQLDLTGFGVSKGIFAPSIRHHDGLFYCTCTLVDGKGNFVVTAVDPAGPWSDPVWLPNVKGIDPSLFFEENGQAWLVYNSAAPHDKALYNGHRTIRMRSFDPVLLQAQDDEIILVNGGTDISKKPIWIEGPHLLQRKDFFYLIAAEGGTGFDHSVVVFRSKSIEGPFIPYEKNPVLCQSHLAAERAFPVTSTGHADLVDAGKDNWQAVFLGCRPYDGDHYNTGRETFLVPVTWTDDWPLLNEGKEDVGYRYGLPLPEKKQDGYNRRSGNFSYRDDFNDTSLNEEWTFLRTPHSRWYELAELKGFVSLKLRPDTCAGRSNPSLLARRQQHLSCSARTALLFRATDENEKAGLLVFQNEDHFYFLCQSVKNDRPFIQLYRSQLMPRDESAMKLVLEHEIEIADRELLSLQITAEKDRYHFYYCMGKNNWSLLAKDIDARFLSTRTAGGFVGCIFGVYATSLGKPSINKAHFDWFEYEGMDEVWEGGRE
ncbi:MAG TPA: glycoside hydrolase family 43 protein [Flavisolibacter sp.]|nr:glycoside hydrolase family 43 protein [Flavisolibacter sp.]